jgi:hypothetical protein
LENPSESVAVNVNVCVEPDPEDGLAANVGMPAACTTSVTCVE